MHGQYHKELKDIKRELEIHRDFIEYLFDHSGHCDHISLGEAWEEFERWEEQSEEYTQWVNSLRPGVKIRLKDRSCWDTIRTVWPLKDMVNVSGESPEIIHKISEIEESYDPMAEVSGG